MSDCLHFTADGVLPEGSDSGAAERTGSPRQVVSGNYGGSHVFDGFCRN